MTEGPIVVRSRSDFSRWREAIGADRPIGFVPTMGFLHAGHVSLMTAARRDMDAVQGVVVVSIFVNPKQFDERGDFEAYPVDRDGDLAKCRAAGVDVVFMPDDAREMYGPHFATSVEVHGLDEHLCGAGRPGHFRGVCTVVLKLWNLVRPTAAYFGRKDYQQLAIIRRMHEDLGLHGRIEGMPIVREEDGLAMSSRNTRLGPQARRDALGLHRTLEAIRRDFAAGQTQVAALLEERGASLPECDLEYLAIVDAATLQPVAHITGPSLCAIAARVGGVRLIDNVELVP